MRKVSRRDMPFIFGNSNDLSADVLLLSEPQAEMIDRENVCDYIQTTASQLSGMARDAQNPFLSYLLNMAAEEARSSKGKLRWEASAA